MTKFPQIIAAFNVILLGVLPSFPACAEQSYLTGVSRFGDLGCGEGEEQFFHNNKWKCQKRATLSQDDVIKEMKMHIEMLESNIKNLSNMNDSLARRIEKIENK